MGIFTKYSKPRLVGLAGTFCSGKDTGAAHLVEAKGFMHVSTGDILRAEASRQGRDHQRSTLIDIALELNREYGSPGAFVFRGIKQWEAQQERFSGGLVISGIRILGEAQAIQAQNGTVFYIDAPEKLRYERAKERVIKEGRMIELAGVNSLEDFIESQKIELEGVGDPNLPHLKAIEEIADVVIQNTGTKKDYFQKIDHSLKLAA